MQKITISLFLFLLPIVTFGQQEANPYIPPTQFKNYSKTEKVYLHTDRDYYTVGGTIFFKAYLVNEALNQTDVESKVLYVDLVDAAGDVLESRTIALENGVGIGDFDLSSPAILGGIYVLRAHTTFMQNFDTEFFFRKTLFIQGVNDPNLAVTKPLEKEEIKLGFFPEGGDLVAGLTSTIAIKAHDKNGAGEKVMGSIITNDGQKIIDFSTDEYGYGLFELKPKQGEEYFGVIEKMQDESIKHKLPIPQKKGVIINVKVESEIVHLKLTASNSKLLKNAFLIAHTRGAVVWETLINEGNLVQFDIEKPSLPTGVIHFTLFDNLKQPQAERLVFNHHGLDNFNIDFSTEKETFGKREKVRLLLEIYDDEGESLPAQLSVSIIDQFLSKPIKNNYDIRSYFLLGAEVKGFIENPDRFFEMTATGIKAMDLIMMTYGWRRFRWKDFIQNPNKEWKFQPENSLSISGKITEKGKPNKPVKAYGYLSEMSANLSMNEFETTDKGFFCVNDLKIKDSVDIIIQAAVVNSKKKEKKKIANSLELKGNRNIDIFFDKRQVFSDKQKDSIYATTANLMTKTIEDLQQAEQVNYAESSIWDGGLSIDLDEVVVKEKRLNKVIAYYEKGMLYKRPSTRILTSSIPTLDSYIDIYDILRGRTTGLQLAAPADGLSKHDVILRGYQTGLSSASGSNAAKFMVNGSLVSTAYAESITPNAIAFIDVISSLSQLSLYGGDGSNGLIMIYLKPPGQRQQKRQITAKGILNFTYAGYNSAREFYAPNYEDLSNITDKEDNRITLHWSPDIKVNDTGEAYIEFFTADRSTIYDITVEGISESGIPIIAKSKLLVE